MSYPYASSNYGASMNDKETNVPTLEFPRPPEGHCWRIKDSRVYDLVRLELLSPPNWRGKRKVVVWTVLNTNPAADSSLHSQVRDRGEHLLRELEGRDDARALAAKLNGLTSCGGEGR